LGSGEAIDEIVEGRRQPHIVSPASAAFIKLGNAQSQSKFGKDLIASTDNLVLSPVVIAMWKPMAEALGWGKKPIGWWNILALARNQKRLGRLWLSTVGKLQVRSYPSAIQQQRIDFPLCRSLCSFRKDRGHHRFRFEQAAHRRVPGRD
jgi:hypothetical protein